MLGVVFNQPGNAAAGEPRSRATKAPHNYVQRAGHRAGACGGGTLGTPRCPAAGDARVAHTTSTLSTMT